MRYLADLWAGLERLMGAGAVQCEDRGRDRFGRSIGLCRAAGRDLGADMVSAGMAWAFTRYSSDYVDQERAALGARLGQPSANGKGPASSGGSFRQAPASVRGSIRLGDESTPVLSPCSARSQIIRLGSPPQSALGLSPRPPGWAARAAVVRTSRR